MSDAIILRTVGIHPYTDLLYLHSVLEGVRRSGLISHAIVEPAAGQHIIRFDGVDEGDVLEALTDWVLTSLVEAVSIDPAAAEGLIRYGSDEIDRGVLRKEVREWVIGEKSPPYTVRDLIKVVGPARRRKERIAGLIKDLRRVGIDLTKITRSILVIPHIGKHKFAPDEIRKVTKTEPIEPIPAIILYAGLKLAAVKPETVGSGDKAMRLSLVGPSAPVPAEDVWRAQAELRYRNDLDPLHGLIEGFYTGRGFRPEAAGVLVSLVIKPVKGAFGVDHTKVVKTSPMAVFVGTKVLMRKTIKEIKALSSVRDFINKVTVVQLKADILGNIPKLISIYEVVGGPVGGLIELMRYTADDIVLRNLLYLALKNADKTTMYRFMRELLTHLVKRRGAARAMKNIGRLEWVFRYLSITIDEISKRKTVSATGAAF